MIFIRSIIHKNIKRGKKINGIIFCMLDILKLLVNPKFFHIKRSHNKEDDKNVKMGSWLIKGQMIIKDLSSHLIVVMICGSGKDNKWDVKVLSTPSPLRSIYINNNIGTCAVWLIVKVSMANITSSDFRPRRINFGLNIEERKESLPVYDSSIGNHSSISRYLRDLHELVTFVDFSSNKNIYDLGIDCTSILFFLVLWNIFF